MNLWRHVVLSISDIISNSFKKKSWKKTHLNDIPKWKVIVKFRRILQQREGSVNVLWPNMLSRKIFVLLVYFGLKVPKKCIRFMMKKPYSIMIEIVISSLCECILMRIPIGFSIQCKVLRTDLGWTHSKHWFHCNWYIYVCEFHEYSRILLISFELLWSHRLWSWSCELKTTTDTHPSRKWRTSDTNSG